MHPAASVILFTTSTGLGYGLLMWLSISFLMMFHSDIVILSTTIAAFILVSFGLCSSLFHLGHPERAWRAMSQWRTSWLSREGLFAVMSFVPMLLMIAVPWWPMAQGWLTVLALCMFGLSVITVYATAMIYASLKPIPAWYNIYTKLGYLLNAAVSGGLGWLVIIYVCGETVSDFQQNALCGLLCLAFFNKLLWFNNLNKTSATDAQTAIGIQGKVRVLDPPHSSDNYLMKEMGFVLARQYRNSVRLVALLSAYLLPLILLVGFNHAVSAGIALTLCMTGMLAERYSFFAEAKHVVTLYYRP